MARRFATRVPDGWPSCLRFRGMCLWLSHSAHRRAAATAAPALALVHASPAETLVPPARVERHAASLALTATPAAARSTPGAGPGVGRRHRQLALNLTHRLIVDFGKLVDTARAPLAGRRADLGRQAAAVVRHELSLGRCGRQGGCVKCH
ncbi:hypothetical protein PLESTM_001014400 [Pleodorina starrii]|nr:hypothetical protein PLESTM_001014400 [Pleodorina starrii]